MGDAPVIPLSAAADAMLAAFQRATGSAAIAQLDGSTLLGERATLRHMLIPATTSANGCCHLLQARGDRVALNLPRPSDVEMLPALLERDAADLCTLNELAASIRTKDATALVARGRSMGIAIAREREGSAPLKMPALAPDAELPAGARAANWLVRGPVKLSQRRHPRVLDLSALWAGPLASHLLWLAGAEVVRVEHRRRPDRMREGDADFFGLLNQGKASVVLDFDQAAENRALHALIADTDIVIEAARPRALLQSGIDATACCERIPGLLWLTITGHGAQGSAANWVGFGDDCGVAGGLSAALSDATGSAGFVGDAIADPLTGIATALSAWVRWSCGYGGRIGVAMSDVVAECIRMERDSDPAAWTASLKKWSSVRGHPFQL